LALIIVVAGSARAAAGDDRPIAPPEPRAPFPSASPTGEIGETRSGDRAIAPARGGLSGALSGEAVRTIVALGGVLILIVVLRQLARRIGDPLAARRPSGVVQVLARYPFGRGRQITLVEVGNRILCLHEATAGVTTLCEVSDPNEVASLRARIDAGSPERERFERELIRETSRQPIGRSGGDERSPLLGLPAETVDLTRRRGGLLSRLAGGSR
jgi:flagellar biogenesis protein FliO